MITVVTPENNKEYNKKLFKVFLAGTIDDGNSLNWQALTIWYLKYFNKSTIPEDDESMGDIIVFNPRRGDWNKNASKKMLEEQIKWEQEKLDEADLIIMHLLDNSKSPISLLELGLYAQSNKLVVFCNKKFYRYTNVKLTCDKYNIPLLPVNDPIDIPNAICKSYSSYTLD